MSVYGQKYVPKPMPLLVVMRRIDVSLAYASDGKEEPEIHGENP
jgi:hypothetical protein